jgi:HD-GYP domain-containing protein (c-di-GMP phosphodiesterase class II)
MQPLPWDVFDETGTLLLSRNSVPTDSNQVRVLIDRGAYVEQEAFESHRYQLRPAAELALNVFEQWEHLHLRLGNLLRRFDREPDFVVRVRQLAEELMELVAKDPDACLFCAIRMDLTTYPIAHCLQVASCCGAYAQIGGWEHQNAVTLVCAALTMNCAMLILQYTLCKQAGPLSPAQQAEVRAHPQLGRDQLAALGVSDEDWLRAVAEHHETGDGKGYPHGLTEMSQQAQVLNVLDRYMALLSPRQYRDAKPANIAARELYLHSSGPLQAVVARLTKSFGLYPPGCFVRLANGDVAAVVHRGEHAGKPRVATLVSGQGIKLLNPIRRDTAAPEYTITQTVAEQTLAIQVDPARLFR